MVPPRLRAQRLAWFCQSVKSLWIPWVFQKNLGCPGFHIGWSCPSPARESWNGSTHCLVCTCGLWRLAVGETFSSTSIEACPWDSVNGWNNGPMRAKLSIVFDWYTAAGRTKSSTMFGDPWPPLCGTQPSPWVWSAASEPWLDCLLAWNAWNVSMVPAMWLPPDHCGVVPVSRDLGHSRRITRLPGCLTGWLLSWWTKLCHKTYILCTCTRTEIHPVRMFPCMLIVHRDRTNTIHVYIVIVMTHVITLEAWQSSQGSFEPITPPHVDGWVLVYPMVPISLGDWGGGGGYLSLLLWIMAATSSLITRDKTCLQY